MSPGRLLICTTTIVAGIAILAIELPHALHALHPIPVTASARLPRGRLEQSAIAARARVNMSTSQPRSGGGGNWLAPLAHTMLLVAECLLGVVMLVIALALRRARGRVRRRYELYELHLSMHDQAKGQDLEDMIEAIANIVRARPVERIRDGQPYVAIELICGAKPDPGGPLEMEWSINVRCEPATATALDAAISAAYPDTRLGHVHGEQPQPRLGVLRQPGHLIRFAKQRSFVYPLIAPGEQQASAPIEQIARAQVATGEPSLVRFQLQPAPVAFEALARVAYRRRERSLLRRERWSRPERVTSAFDRAELKAGERTHNRSLFWLETVVAADTAAASNTIAAVLQSRRGENRLRRVPMLARDRLYRRRFPRALAPLLPSPRSLMSAAEAAHLLELPSARMKGVPVHRITIPRIPAPPEVARADRARPSHPSETRQRQATIAAASS